MPTKKAPQLIQFEQTKQRFESLIVELNHTLKLMPQKGNSTSECQKLCIQQAINELDYTINGIQESDFIANSYSKDFKLSYS